MLAYLLPWVCSFHGCWFCRCSSFLIYRYSSWLCAGEVETGACDGAPKFGTVLANVIDARRRLTIGDFWRFKSCWVRGSSDFVNQRNCCTHHFAAIGSDCRWGKGCWLYRFVLHGTAAATKVERQIASATRTSVASPLCSVSIVPQ